MESQKWFVQRKWEQIRDGARLRQGSGEVNIFIQDVAPETDYCYAETNRRLGRMSEEHFGEYETFFRSLDWTIAPAPDLLVYLKASDEALLARANESKREFETVDDEYFLTMKQVNREWIAGVGENGDREYRILEINTDNFDFAHNEAAKNKLVEIVASNLEMI